MTTEYSEAPWVEMASDGEGDGEGFNGMFDDPDPFDTFVHTFNLPSGADAMETIEGKDGHLSDVCAETVTIVLRGHKAENGQTLNSTGLTLWRAAPILCQFLINNSDLYVRNKCVLELGGGLGLCGILAGLLRSKCVYLTDGDSESLQGMRQNVDRNRSTQGPYNIKCRQLRWGIRLSEFIMHVSADVRFDGTFDVVMGSDIIYVESILDPLFATVDALLTKDGSGVFILAYARRNVKIDLVFSTAGKYGFQWSQPEGEEGCFLFRRT